jgi:phage gpG-like protein
MPVKYQDFGLTKRLSEAARRKLRKTILRTFREEGRRAAGEITKKGIRGGGGPLGSESKSGRLFTRSGSLRRTIGSRTLQMSDRTFVSLGTTEGSSVYARIHEEGGTIRPKRQKFLTIPLPASYFPSGVKRWTARELMEDPSPFDNTFVYDRGFGKRTILGVKGPHGAEQFTPLFLLRKRVTIPARPFVGPAFEKMKKLIIKRLHRMGAELSG